MTNEEKEIIMEKLGLGGMFNPEDISIDIMSFSEYLMLNAFSYLSEKLPANHAAQIHELVYDFLDTACKVRARLP